MMRPLATFSFFIFFNKFFIFSLPSSLLPTRPSFLLIPPSFWSLLPPCKHCQNHLESVKAHFSSILTKALRTDGPTDRPTDRRTRPLIEMRTHLKIGKTIWNNFSAKGWRNIRSWLYHEGCSYFVREWRQRIENGASASRMTSAFLDWRCFDSDLLLPRCQIVLSGRRLQSMIVVLSRAASRFHLPSTRLVA